MLAVGVLSLFSLCVHQIVAKRDRRLSTSTAVTTGSCLIVFIALENGGAQVYIREYAAIQCLYSPVV